MRPYITSKEPLTSEQITEQLLKLRKNAYIESSHFAVAAILEYQSKEGYIYVFGVNVEDRAHNRLGLHAEQCAVANATALLGDNVKFSKIWVMGGLDTVNPDLEDKRADSQVMECGHCRQLTLSHASQEATMVAVSINGTFSASYHYPYMLPNAFSEQDLGITNSSDNTNYMQAIFDNSANIHSASESTESKESPKSSPSKVTIFKPAPNPLFYPHKLLHFEEVHENFVAKYLLSIKPHIIDANHITSNIISCALQFSKDNKHFYVMGTLTQDIAFLTTEALYAALGMAATAHGGSNITLEKMHILVHDQNRKIMTGAELESAGTFTNKKNIPIFVYGKDGLNYKTGFYNALDMFAQSMKIAPDLALNETAKKQHVNAM